MKTLNIFTVLAAVILTSSAFADNVPTSLPPGAISMGVGGTNKQYSSVAEAINNCQAVRERATYEVYAAIAAATSLDDIKQYEFTGRPNIQGDAQYACKEIILRTLPSISYAYVSVTVHAFCVPRSLAEKQLASFSKRCELNPVDSCFEERVLRRLESLQPTRVTYDHSAPCRVSGNEK